MLVRECLERIRFNTSTLDDLSGKSINTLFNNRNIVQQLMYALDKYASETIALQGIYSMPLTTNDHVIEAPPLALRTKTYRLAMVWIDGIKYLLDVVNLNPAEAAFQYQWQGVPRWLVAWNGQLYVYPTPVSNYYSTTLAAGISKTDTTIELVDSSGLQPKSGRVTIGEEKITYKYNQNNTLYECQRGEQDTTKSAHSIGDTLKEDNIWLFYYKRHFRIPVYTNDVIDKEVLDRNMEVCDEHMEIITDYTSFKLLSKVDPTRGAIYKVNFDEWLLIATAKIRRGQKMTTAAGGDIRGPIWFETNNSGVYLV